MAPDLLARFALGICGCTGSWSMAAYRSRAIAAIRSRLAIAQVICGLSGGVDSSVAAVLIHEAIGAQLTCVFVDHGLLRAGEAEEVVRLFGDHYNIPLIIKTPPDCFLGRLQGSAIQKKSAKSLVPALSKSLTAKPARSRCAVFGPRHALSRCDRKHFSRWWHAVTIKSHHNVGGLPDDMALDLVEPLRELFKDEVRELGRELGLPESLVGRHPFPGPGLAIRIPGDITVEKLDILRAADAVYLDEIRKAGLYDEIWQAFAVLLPVKTVGVMGDARSYEYVLCASGGDLQRWDDR